MRGVSVLFFIVLLFNQKIYSQTCCSGGVPLSNNIGLPSAEKGILQVSLSYDYNNLNTLNEGSKKLEDNNRLRITHSALVNLGYSITDKLSVEGLFSWVNQRRRIITNNTLSQTSGIGDAILLSRYKFYDKNFFTFSVGAGVKLPTGASDKKNDIGIVLNADLQPGSNALDAIFMTSISKQFNFRKSLTFSSRLTYRNTGVNSEYLGVDEYKFGNETQLFFSIVDQFLVFNKLINPRLTLKYRQVLKDKINNTKISNTGGKWFFLKPGFSISSNDNIDFITSVELPVYSNVEGIQLTPTSRINFSILIQLFKNKSKNKFIYNSNSN